MDTDVRMVNVDGQNFETEGFFCYKSKPKSEGYQRKLTWLQDRFDEGMQIDILYEGKRSMGFIEYIPGEYAWRVVHAPNHLVIHCLWVVGRGKGKGYGSILIQGCVDEARRQGKQGVVMVSSRGNWLASEKVFLKNGFEHLESAPPSFELLVRKLKDGPLPSFPKDWDDRAAHFGEGMTVVYTDQCPYIPDAVEQGVQGFEQRGIPARAIRLESREELMARSPSPYGVFGIVRDGRLFSYHYLGKKEFRQLDEGS